MPLNKETKHNLSRAIAPSQSGPGSDGNKWVLHIPQRPSITRTSQSDCLGLYSEHSLERSYISADM